MKKIILVLIMCVYSFLFSQEIDLKLSQSTYLIYQQKNRSSFLDPENIYIKSDNYTFHNFINVGTNINAENFLVKGSVQLDYNELKKEKYDFSFKEAFFSYDLSEKLVLQVGRKFINWGVAYYIKPSAILDPQRNVSDFDNQGNKFVGNDVVELDYYAGDILFRGVYKNSFNNFNFRKSNYISNINFLIAGWSVNLIGGYEDVSKFKGGFNFTKVISDQLEIHGEFINEKNRNSYVMTDNQLYLYSKERINKITLGFLLSMNISNRDVRLICEYNYDQGGLTKNQWDIYKSSINKSLIDMKNPSADIRELAKSNYIQSTSAYNVQEFSRSSIIFIIDNFPPLLKFIYYKPIVLFNLEDKGAIFILNLLAIAGENINFFFNTNYYGGSKNSLYFNIPHEYQLFFGISTSFNLLNQY